MGRLYLVRHGQTGGFLTGAYTDLTPLGVAQARALGAWMAHVQLRPDAVFVGPRERHVQTHQACADAAGGPWPAPTALPDLDEHHAFAVVGHLLSEGQGALADSLRTAVAGGDSAQVLRVFREMMHAWSREEVRAPGEEDWGAFGARVARGLDTLCAAVGAGQTVLAFTSGGFVGVGSALLLGVTAPSSVVDLAFGVENTAFTEVRLQGGRRTLYRFNAAPHAGPAMLLTGI